VCVCALAVITESGSIALLGGAQVSPDWGVPVLLCVYLCVCVCMCVCVCVCAGCCHRIWLDCFPGCVMWVWVRCVSMYDWLNV
jgi:hypothetical protein